MASGPPVHPLKRCGTLRTCRDEMHPLGPEIPGVSVAYLALKCSSRILHVFICVFTACIQAASCLNTRQSRSSSSPSSPSTHTACDTAYNSPHPITQTNKRTNKRAYAMSSNDLNNGEEEEDLGDRHMPFGDTFKQRADYNMGLMYVLMLSLSLSPPNSLSLSHTHTHTDPLPLIHTQVRGTPSLPHRTRHLPR